MKYTWFAFGPLCRPAGRWVHEVMVGVLGEACPSGPVFRYRCVHRTRFHDPGHWARGLWRKGAYLDLCHRDYPSL